MAVALTERLKARREARFHVQVQLEAKPAVFSTPGKAAVAGLVTRLFRSDGSLAVGDRVTFSVHVFRQGEQSPPGPAYLLYDKLDRATYIEAYLNGTPPQCHIPLDECAILAAPQVEPRMSVTELETLVSGVGPGRDSSARRREWWRFWRD